MIVPSISSIKKVFHTHQNQCALIQCNKKIIDEDGHVNGNIFFIESNVKGQARYNPDLTNEHMNDYHNLILLCDVHGLDIEWKEKKFTLERLRREILVDQDTIFEHNFELDDKMIKNVIENFVEYHDPDRLSHINYNLMLDDHQNIYSLGFFWFSDSRVFIKPTRNFVGGRFEIIDTKEKFEKTDKIIFIPKNNSKLKGIEVKTEFKSKMSIAGRVPNLPKGDYTISIINESKDTSKFDQKLTFKILGENPLKSEAIEQDNGGNNEKKEFQSVKFSSIGFIGLMLAGIFFFISALYLITTGYNGHIQGVAYGYQYLVALIGSTVLIYAGIRGIKHKIEWDRALK